VNSRASRFLVVATLLALAFTFVKSAPTWRAHPLEAFVTYYCGGAAVRAGVDPYGVAFVSACEHTAEPNLLPADVVEPAVLPPPAFSAFALFALLPYAFAGRLFVVILLAALLGSAACLARVTGLRTAVPLGAFAFLCGFVNLYYGEIVPIVLFGICLAGWALSRERYAVAATGIAIALVEPHVAVPAALAAFAGVPRMRAPLAIVAVIFCALGLSLGPEGFIHYARDVLPLHAWAEIPAVDQYSATWIWHWFGGSDAAALRVGSVSSLLGWIAGIFVALRVARRLESPAALVFVPVAFALVVPLFVHDLQLPLAIPAGLLLARRGRFPSVAWTGVALAAFPWVPSWLSHANYVLVPIAAAAIAVGAAASTRARVALGASLAFGYVAIEKLLFHARAIVATSADFAPEPTGADPGLASLSWGRYMRSGPTSRELALGTLGGKLLSFAGPLAVVVAALLELRGSDAVAQTAVELTSTSVSATPPDARPDSYPQTLR
jgi:hypothetical protein